MPAGMDVALVDLAQRCDTLPQASPSYAGSYRLTFRETFFWMIATTIRAKAERRIIYTQPCSSRGRLRIASNICDTARSQKARAKMTKRGSRLRVQNLKKKRPAIMYPMVTI